MRIIIPTVMSADGRITKGDNGNVHDWSSQEDFQFFNNLVDQHKVLVMGRRTYEAVQPVPSPDKLRIVLTTQPDQFSKQVVPGALEFMNRDPKKVIQELTERGYETALLVGGAPVHAAFLQAGLVDELYLTIEPALFGAGRPFIEGAVDTSMKLLEVKQLNDKGTLLLHYQVIKD